MIDSILLIISKIKKNIDWIFWISLFFLVFTGIVSIYSASSNYSDPTKFITTQIIALFLGLALAGLFASFNYQHYKHFNVVIYILSCLLLIAVLFFGSTINGTTGWFRLWHFSMQPVELTKIMFVLVLATFLDGKWKEIEKFSTFTKALLLMLGHIFLIMLQPDFSSTIPYYPITLAMLYVAGVKLRYLLSVMLYGALAVGIPLLITFIKLQPEVLSSSKILTFIVTASNSIKIFLLVLAVLVIIVFSIKWFLNKLRINLPVIYPIIFLAIVIAGSFSSVIVEKSLKEYQRKRLIVFLKPEIDSRGSGYNIIQSKITIGSGKILGKSFFNGTQTQLGFLPEQRTDFIFAVIGEEGGYLISQLTILFYFLLVWRAMRIAKNSRDRYGSLVASGSATMFAFYGIINIGMVTGLMPATGLPLMFVSYGGSSLVSAMICVGILLSIHIRRFQE